MGRTYTYEKITFMGLDNIRIIYLNKGITYDYMLLNNIIFFLN